MCCVIDVTNCYNAGVCYFNIKNSNKYIVQLVVR